MEILCIGAGAVGSFFCGLMGKNHQVHLIARGKHLEAMKKTGKLFVKSHLFGDIEIGVSASDKPSSIYDIIFISTKSQDTEAACEIIKKHIKDETIIVSLQNGVDNPDLIKKHFPTSKIIAASVFIGISVESPAVLNHSAEGRVIIGSIDEKVTSEDLNNVKKLFDEINIPCTISDNIRYVAWKKLLWNLVFNPLSALLEATCGRLVDSQNSRYIMGKMLDEGVMAAETQGIKIEEEYLRKVMDVSGKLYDYKTSMFQDIQKLKTPEIDGIMLPVIEKLRSIGSSAPYTETAYNLLKFKYGKHYIYPPKPTVDVIVYNSKNEILLIERRNPPYGWAIPGGFIDYGERVEDAAKRELLEETGIVADRINFLGIYSDPERDPRFHTIGTVYYTFSDEKPTPQDDAKDARFFPIDNLPENIAFDHRQIIEDFIKKISGE